jgi:hypothetical protein
MAKKKKDPQPSLFPEPQNKIRADFPITIQPRRTDPDTSKNWARNLNPDTKKNKAILILYRQGRKSSRQIAQLTGEEVQNVSPIFAPMVRAELIREAGVEDNWTLYELTDLGREFALRLAKGE